MKFARNEQGTVAVLVALSMMVLIGLTAIVIDGGRLFLEQSRLQKAIDAAVLAGAQELPTRPDLARQQAEQAASANGISVNEIVLTFENGNTLIRAQTARTEPLTFGNALGFSSSNVEAKAAVQLRPLTSAIGVIPLGVDYSRQLSFGDPVVMKAGEADVGNFGALALSGPGADHYEEDLHNGSQSEISVGDILDTQTGNLVGPTIQGLEDRMAACSDGSVTYYNYPPDCPRVVLVPVYKPIGNSHQLKQVEVVGFASFFIESVGDPNEGAEVVGRFIQTAYSGSSSSDTGDYGTYGYKLIE